ncbi:MAG: hypothetical protein VKL42_03765 [Snowella sp.]|nr:hypothetical protein [Snowella sp.]
MAQLISDRRLYVPNHAELPDLAQCKPNPNRIKQIANYILDNYQTGTIYFLAPDHFQNGQKCCLAKALSSFSKPHLAKFFAPKNLLENSFKYKSDAEGGQ